MYNFQLMVYSHFSVPESIRVQTKNYILSCKCDCFHLSVTGPGRKNIVRDDSLFGFLDVVDPERTFLTTSDDKIFYLHRRIFG